MSTLMQSRIEPSRALRQQFLLGLLLLGLTLGWTQEHARAQSASDSYTVQSGDTLGNIATRFGVSLESLMAANGLDNPDWIIEGQTLLIPDSTHAGFTVRARPGDTVTSLAVRYDVQPQQLAAFNQFELESRLFPGQPLQLPESVSDPAAIALGAIRRILLPQQILQGRTDWLVVETSRPLELTASWNGLPLSFAVLDSPLRQFAYLPVPALLGPGSFDLEIGYTAANGMALQRTLPLVVADGGYGRQQINLPPGKGQLLDPQLVQAELVKLQAVWLQTTPRIRWTQPFTRPIGLEYPTTSPFGTRRSYNGGPYSSHAGQDFGAPFDVPVTAPAAGAVAMAEPLVVRGNVVILDHGLGVFTGYWHLNEIKVQVGQEVEVGDLLGLVGTTGLSTGAHLHWEMRIYGIAVDPMQFLSESLVPPGYLAQSAATAHN
jgi:murein DD-endopeptidase MepM/ murein hydrolase activator NlpD